MAELASGLSKLFAARVGVAEPSACICREGSPSAKLLHDDPGALEVVEIKLHRSGCLG